MKRLILLFLVVSIILSSCSDDDNPVDANDDAIKNEAVNFSLEVVNCFFTQDTTELEKQLPDILYMIDPEESPYQTAYFILSHYLSSYDYSEFNLDQYKDTYNYRVLEYNEYTINAEQWLDALIYWTPTEEDFLFIGYELKEDKIPFMDYKPLVFFVTKSSGQWKIKAIQ